MKQAGSTCMGMCSGEFLPIKARAVGRMGAPLGRLEQISHSFYYGASVVGNTYFWTQGCRLSVK